MILSSCVMFSELENLAGRVSLLHDGAEATEYMSIYKNEHRCGRGVM